MSSLLDRLLGLAPQKHPMGVLLLRQAQIVAWQLRHHEVAPVHLAYALVGQHEVHPLLEAEGVRCADAEAVIEQLLEELPTRDEADPDVEPTLQPLVDAIGRAWARIAIEHVNVVTIVLGLASLLPPELGFLRAPLERSARGIGALYDVTLTYGPTGSIVLDRWEHAARGVVGAAQQLVRGKAGAWNIGPAHVLIAFCASKLAAPALARRGLTFQALADVLLATFERRGGKPGRARPESLVPAYAPSMFALVVRTERYAAADHTDVRLRHLLHALHDIPELAPTVDMLVGDPI